MKPRTGTNHFTSKLDYNVSGQTAIVESKGKTGLRMIEPWALCYKVWLENEHKILITKIKLVVSGDAQYAAAEVESFVRRVSFLNINNTDLDFEVIVNNVNIELYDFHSLVNRPANEIINSKLNERNADDEPGRLEKDFQAFLFGGTILANKNIAISETSDIYRRLGVLGIDFYQLKNSYKVLREFPTGVFNVRIQAKNRVLPTYYADIVAFNKHKELAIIELKLNDPKIEVISQLLDYALFFRAYKTQIANLIQDKLCPAGFEKKPISCYVANNHFHPRFEGILKYYSTDPQLYGFSLNMITLGATKVI